MKNKILILLLISIYAYGQDGSIDLNFNSTINLNNTVESIKEQSDGKILIGGSFNSSLERLNIDGSIDNSFLGSNILNGTVYDIDIQNDNKIIIGGTFINRIKRLNSNGTVDATFNCSVQGGNINCIQIQSNSKIIICGNFSTINGSIRNGIARLNSDGTLDNSFNLNLPQGISVADFGFQSSGKIIIAGEYLNASGTNIVLVFERYDSNNSKDLTFNVGGTNASSNILDIDISSDDKIMICGYFLTFNGIQTYGLARLNSNGTLDSTFNSYNFSTYSILGIKCLLDGKYIINGTFELYNGQNSSKIAKLNHNGTIDNTFNIGTGANGYFILETEIQNNGKILIGGDFTIFNNFNKNRIARLGNTLLSTNEIENLLNFNIYPNPTKELINFDNKKTISCLKILNSIGQEVKTFNKIELSNNKINIQNLQNGIYFLKINIDDIIITKKIIKN
jgi:uncharacterized delta-60 repeat protein